MNCVEILTALRRKHDLPRNGVSRAWVFAEEVRTTPGWWGGLEIDGQVYSGEQRIDAFALALWHSFRYERVAYEIKVSRSDLLRELANPWKCEAALALSNRFYLVVPYDVPVDPKELPSQWGLLVLSRSGRFLRKKLAPWRDTPEPPHIFMLSLARNLAALENKSIPLANEPDDGEFCQIACTQGQGCAQPDNCLHNHLPRIPFRVGEEVAYDHIEDCAPDEDWGVVIREEDAEGMFWMVYRHLEAKAHERHYLGFKRRPVA